MIDYVKTLAHVAEIAVGAGEEHYILEQIAAQVVSLFHAETAIIFRYGQENNPNKIASAGLLPQTVRKLEEAEGNEWYDRFLAGVSNPIILENAGENPPTEQLGVWASLLDADTIAITNILSGGEPIGMLAVFHQKPQEYTPQDCHALQTLAALCATAMSRANIPGQMRLTSNKSQLFSVLSHELRTPLTSIMGFTQLIRKRLNASGNSDPRMVEQLDVLWAQAQRLNRLIDTFVDISRIERGEFEITQGQVELTDMLRMVAQQAVAQASSHHQVNIDVPTEPLWMHGDNKRLEQVFSHIISNAVRYSPQEQPIKISCRQNKTESKAIVEITDRGPGIPATRLRDLFDRNYPVGPLKAGGLGVGLYLSKVIVEAHGGHISLISTPGEGTTARIELPI